MRNEPLLLFFLVGALLTSGTAFAHHGSASYDRSKTVTVTGTVTDFLFINPHVLIAVDVKDPSGKVETWKAELTSANSLQRAGWTKNTLKLGDQITLVGGSAKNGSPVLFVGKVMKGGEEISIRPGSDN
jgi:hypothetical protein